MSIVHLRAAGVSLVLDTSGPALPRVLHWGGDLGDVTARDLAALPDAVTPPGHTEAEPCALPAVIPEHATGWDGRPGLSGHRDGRHWSPRFRTAAVRVEPHATGGGLVVAEAADDVAQLALGVEIELTPQGLVRMRARLTSSGADDPYTLDRLTLALPVPAVATELLDLAGRWSRERTPQRLPLVVGAHVRDVRRGRSGFDSPLVLVAGEAGFGFRHGQVWGLHTAWGGGHVHEAERLPGGEQGLAGGESLWPGEVRLDTGDTYTTPWVVGSYGVGMDAMAGRFHAWLRAREAHPVTPRPVVMNTWEAVYFEHDLDRLRALADAGAAVGVERYVLDDGWFRGRRSERAGLGDWTVDPDVWPDGLHPLVDHVRALGMEFGLWFEPEMVNPDSDLARAHPEWILQTGDRLPPLVRSQQVLDLTHPGAYAHVRDHVLALVREYRLDYLKWDHNRDLVDAGSTRTGGAAAMAAQTRAVYRLLDEIRAAAPGLEIEACASGGGRVDLETLAHTDRVWASDCIDALERQRIQRWTAQLLPPELVGAHVGAPTSHTTGRTHALDLRAGTALFGHLGVEWDLTRASDDERARLAAWIVLHKRFRGLLASGLVVRADHPDDAVWLHGVVAADRAEALFAVVAMDRSDTWPPGALRLPGLDDRRRYRVAPVGPGADLPELWTRPAWWAGVELPGRVLREVGLQAPPLRPETLVLLHVVAVE